MGTGIEAYFHECVRILNIYKYIELKDLSVPVKFLCIGSPTSIPVPQLMCVPQTLKLEVINSNKTT